MRGMVVSWLDNFDIWTLHSGYRNEFFATEVYIDEEFLFGPTIASHLPDDMTHFRKKRKSKQRTCKRFEGY